MLSETELPEVPDISELLLRRDVQKALSDLLEQLPKFTPILRMAGKGMDAARDAITDPDFMGGVEDFLVDKSSPIRKKVSEAASILQETKVRAEQDHSYIGVFGLLRMLKDPNVQYALHYIQALVDVASDHRRSSRKDRH